MPFGFEQVAEFFFKYRPGVFEKGRFAFAAGRPAMVVALVLVVLGLALLVTYRRAPGHASPRFRARSRPG
jgi:hypothetical protein